ncbi:MAG: apolipoprotein N-acyltransferase, partial [Deltaproteobacteria bacterium]|nr:apolipoprotein N-acyltransferase [Deltaproteobacteria bacterium]
GGACLALVGSWSFLAARDYFAQPPWFAALFALSLPLTASGIALYYAAAFPCVRVLARLTGAERAARRGSDGTRPGTRSRAIGGTCARTCAHTWGRICARVCGFASIWTLCEAVRASLWMGNPWAKLGDALADSPLLAAAADLGGVWLLSWLAAAVSASVGVAWAERGNSREVRRALGVGAALLAFQFGYGGWSLSPSDSDASSAASAPVLRVAIVQAAIGKHALWKSDGPGDAFETQIALSRSAALAGADLVVWPENATTFLIDANPERRARLQGLARDLGAALLVGGSRSAAAPGGDVRVYNSAFLFRPGGDEPSVYDKRILMPYTEHVPAWAAALVGSSWQGAYGAGTVQVLFDVKGWKIAPLLCFESIYPGLAREAAQAGADLLVNLSNDSWFDQGAGPEQHFAMARLRAIENHLPLLRVATTGISALVDARGRLVQQLPSRRQEVALVEVRRGPGPSWFASAGSVLRPLNR